MNFEQVQTQEPICISYPSCFETDQVTKHTVLYHRIQIYLLNSVFFEITTDWIFLSIKSSMTSGVNWSSQLKKILILDWIWMGTRTKLSQNPSSILRNGQVRIQMNRMNTASV